MNTFAVTKSARMDIRLSEIKVGKSVVIKYFEKDDIFLKLMEMGCVPGEIVIVDQIAPLGDPISILVAGYHLSLRLNEAENIWVEEIVAEKKSFS
jgi:ferrous iron transport protein A